MTPTVFSTAVQRDKCTLCAQGIARCTLASELATAFHVLISSAFRRGPCFFLWAMCNERKTVDLEFDPKHIFGSPLVLQSYLPHFQRRLGFVEIRPATPDDIRDFRPPIPGRRDMVARTCRVRARTLPECAVVLMHLAGVVFSKHRSVRVHLLGIETKGVRSFDIVLKQLAEERAWTYSIPRLEAWWGPLESW